MLDNALMLTLLFIIVSTLLGVFIQRRSRDRCLKDFSKFIVTVEQITGKIIWGMFHVEHTGLELTYQQKKTDAEGHIEGSYIFYKSEYSSMRALLRFHDQLTPEMQKLRERDLESTYHPPATKVMRRKIRNIFTTLRDSILEIVNVVLAQAKKASPAGAVLTKQDKYVNQMKSELIDSGSNAFDPILERHIGKRVVLEMMKGDQVVEYSGILKEYTSEFIEVMDVDYALESDGEKRKADLIVQRKIGMIRHLGE